MSKSYGHFMPMHTTLAVNKHIQCAGNYTHPLVSIQVVDSLQIVELRRLLVPLGVHPCSTWQAVSLNMWHSVSNQSFEKDSMYKAMLCVSREMNSHSV